MESFTPGVSDGMRKRASAWRSGTAHSMQRKIKNGVLRRNTARCHTQRHVTREHQIEKACDFLAHRVVTTGSIEPETHKRDKLAISSNFQARE
jgi:hypothetical protein